MRAGSGCTAAIRRIAGFAAHYRSPLTADDGASPRHDGAGGPHRRDPAGSSPPPAAPLLCRAGHQIARESASSGTGDDAGGRSEEHTSELQFLMRISYAVFCLKKKIKSHYFNRLQYICFVYDI